MLLRPIRCKRSRLIYHDSSFISRHRAGIITLDKINRHILKKARHLGDVDDDDGCVGVGDLLPEIATKSQISFSIAGRHSQVSQGTPD